MKRTVLFLSLSLIVATSAFAGSASTTNTNNITASVSKNTALTATAYGRVAAGQDAAVLSYQDTLVATVTF